MSSISIVMSVHNGMPYLEQCLQSIKVQTLGNYEMILVDDLSTDGSREILRRAARSDSRIRLLENEVNLGLTRSLNKALSVAMAPYIARIDADDLCNPVRLERQFAFLENNSDFVACATGFRMIDHAGRTLRTEARGLDDWQIRWLLGFNPPAPHPTYFFRRLTPTGEAVLYDETFRTAQDYELWSRLSNMGKTCVLPEVLIDYRRHDGAITTTRRTEQAANCAKIGRANLQSRYGHETLCKLDALVALFAYERSAEPGTVAEAVQGIEAIFLAEKPTLRTHQTWLRRKLAGLLAEAVLARGGGLQNTRTILEFLRYAHAYLPALAAEVLSEPGLALKSLRAVSKR